jgi:outer membrane protein TolC
MEHKFFIIVIAIALSHTVDAQLSIEACYEKAMANYPLIRQYDLIEKSKDYNLSNIGKGYLPRIQISAKAAYQSEVIQIPVDIPGVKGLSKDQYSAAIDISQHIWDGGVIKARKENVRSQAEIDKMNLEVSLYAIRERVNHLFFGILLHNEMLKQNALYQDELQRNYKQVSAYMQNGMANRADLDAVEVEQIKASQNRTELSHGRKAYLEMFSALVGERIDEETVLIKPAVDQLYALHTQRPELSLYEAQFRSLDAQRKEVDAGLMPKFNVFVTGGYGKPGLNLLENKFSGYYIGGVSLSWNLGGFYTRKNRLQNIAVNRSMIETLRETFLFNNRLDITQNDNEVRKMRQILTSDHHIIRLRGSVKRSAEAKVGNGTLSVLDLMKEIHLEQQAIQHRIVHEIELIQAIYNLKYITNH